MGPTVGHYVAHEVGRLAGVDGDRVGQWARWGHIRASISAGDPHRYSFDDVADALAVRLLLDGGVPLPTIRRAVDRLGGEHPLASGLHLINGRLAVERERGLEDVFTTQRVFEYSGRLDPVALVRAGGWPALATGVDLVEVDPARAGGRPCVRGRRVTVEDAVADPAGLEIGDVDALRRWWACCD